MIVSLKLFTHQHLSFSDAPNLMSDGNKEFKSLTMIVSLELFTHQHLSFSDAPNLMSDGNKEFKSLTMIVSLELFTHQHLSFSDAPNLMSDGNKEFKSLTMIVSLELFTHQHLSFSDAPNLMSDGNQEFIWEVKKFILVWFNRMFIFMKCIRLDRFLHYIPEELSKFSRLKVEITLRQNLDWQVGSFVISVFV